MGLAVGIDLGTTNCAVARIDEHGYPVTIPNALGELITPSVICFRPGETVIGREAKELQAAGEENIAAFFKRRMGSETFLFHAHGKDYSPIDLSALLLRKLKSDAEATLNQAITDAVITVPAYFKNPEREATRAAGVQAGLNVLQLVNEPTAAAIAYGVRRSKNEGLILVYDLGGGTFDVTLCRLEKDDIKIVTSTGDHELGGKDWDDRLVQFVAGAFEREFGVDPFADPVSIADLQARAEEAKKKLSALDSARVSLVHAGRRGTYEVTRAKFAEITEDLLRRTVELTDSVLKDMKIEPAALGSILLVGGSTRMPMVHDYMRRAFGKAPSPGVNVDEAVALGAALLAGEGRKAPGAMRIGGRVKTTDVTNHSLGMIALNADRSAYLNSIILPKNQPLPCSQTRPYKFRTRARGDNRLEIFMTQGEISSPADVTYIGKYVISDIPHFGAGEAVLDIEYAYDASGTVHVAGKLREGGAALTIAVETLPEDLPDRFLAAPKPEPAPEHVSVYLAVDLSGSMSGDPLAAAKKAAHEFMSKVDLAHMSVGVIAVADRTAVKLKACQNARDVARAIDGLTIGEVGIGNGAHPFDEAYGLLHSQKGSRYLVVLADGVWSDQPTATTRAQRCHKDGIEVIAIGFGGADVSFLRAIASSEEGSIFTNLGALSETFCSIAQVLTETSGSTSGRTLLGRLRGP